MAGLINPAAAFGGAPAQPQQAAPAPTTNASPYTIGGALPWSGGGGTMDFSGSPAGLSASYAGAYNSALSMNQANYNNILAGYQSTMANQVGAEQAIQGGYTDLYNNVLSGIQGIGASQGQAINDQYAQQLGQQTQGLVDRGLGNTTVQNSVQRGLALDQSKAQVALSNQIAGTTAQYQSNLGLAGLQYGNQASQQNTALAGQQLNWMNSVNAGYPNAQAYASLAQQAGAAGQSQQDQAALRSNRGGPTGAGSSGAGVYRSPNFGSPSSFGPQGGSLDMLPSGAGYNTAPMSYTPAAAPTPAVDPYEWGGGGSWGGDNGLAAVTGIPALQGGLADAYDYWGE